MALVKRKQADGDGAEERSVAQAGQEQEQQPAATTDEKTDRKADNKADKKADKKAERAERKSDKKGERAAAKPAGEHVAKLRSRVAQLVWLLFVVAALFLAIGALCIALGANKDNGLVSFVLSGARKLDLGVFSLKNGIKHFTGSHAPVKNALFNWGIGAVLYLIVGRIVERIIRP